MYPIDFFWRAVERYPENIAIDTPEGCINYKTLAARVAALSSALVAMDGTLQSRVGICAKNTAHHIVALLAVLACGKVWVPLNPMSTLFEIRRIIDATEPSILVIDKSCSTLMWKVRRD
jgi:acyl-CoA synthetase (AMP-forming)/AMP-acid ligase II